LWLKNLFLQKTPFFFGHFKPKDYLCASFFGNRIEMAIRPNFRGFNGASPPKTAISFP
jgi:hypothetical protein